MTRKFRSEEVIMETLLDLLKVVVYVGCACVVVMTLAFVYTLKNMRR